MAISNKLKYKLDHFCSLFRKAGVGTVLQGLQTSVATAESDITALEALTNGIEIVHTSLTTTAGGAAAEAITVSGVAATDVALAVIKDDGTNNVSIVSVACTTDTVTVTFSGDPSSDAVINLIVLRPSA